MIVYADLHVHLGASTKGAPVKVTASRCMTVNSVLEDCLRTKGIRVVGFADAGSPHVLEDISVLMERGELVDRSGGGLLYRGEVLAILGSEVEVPGPNARGAAHILAYFPTCAQMREWSSFLATVVTNNTLSTQRARVDFDTLARRVRQMGGSLVVAHAFTPHKSAYGACVRRLTELMSNPSDLAGIELGLSSDTYLADRIRELGRFSFLSNSDAHSLARIGREYNIVELADFDYSGFFSAVVNTSLDEGTEALGSTASSTQARILENRGLHPALGKYYRTACTVCGAIAEDEPPIATCSACGSGEVVMGVLDRIETISDSPLPMHPKGRPIYRHHVPLSLIPGVGLRAIDRLVAAFGSELGALNVPTQSELAEVVGAKSADLIVATRDGRFSISAGGGGVYGRIAAS